MRFCKQIEGVVACALLGCFPSYRQSQAILEMTTWPEHIREEQWGPYGHNPTGPSVSRQQLMDPVFAQAPVPPNDFSQGLATAFAQTHATGGHPQHQHHFIGNHTNLHRHNIPTDSLPTLSDSNGNIFGGAHTFVPNVGSVNDDRRYRSTQRRPPHWEDDPYPASSLRDSITWNQIRAALGCSGHHCGSGIHHCYSFCPPSSCANDCQSLGHGQYSRNPGCHCNHWNGFSSCRGPQLHTPSHTGSFTCSGRTFCDDCGRANTQHTASLPIQSQREPATTKDVSILQEVGGEQSTTRKRDGGGLGKWLARCLCTWFFWFIKSQDH